MNEGGEVAESQGQQYRRQLGHNVPWLLATAKLSVNPFSRCVASATRLLSSVADPQRTRETTARMLDDFCAEIEQESEGLTTDVRGMFLLPLLKVLGGTMQSLVDILPPTRTSEHGYSRQAVVATKQTEPVNSIELQNVSSYHCPEEMPLAKRAVDPLPLLDHPSLAKRLKLARVEGEEDPPLALKSADEPNRPLPAILQMGREGFSTRRSRSFVQSRLNFPGEDVDRRTQRAVVPTLPTSAIGRKRTALLGFHTDSYEQQSSSSSSTPPVQPKRTSPKKATAPPALFHDGAVVKEEPVWEEPIQETNATTLPAVSAKTRGPSRTKPTLADAVSTSPPPGDPAPSGGELAVQPSPSRPVREARTRRSTASKLSVDTEVSPQKSNAQGSLYDRIKSSARSPKLRGASTAGLLESDGRRPPETTARKAFSMSPTKRPSVKSPKKQAVAASSVSPQLYEVGRILEKKMIKKKVYYHVTWKGYPISAATWEPEANIACCTDALRRFKLAEEKKKKTEKKEKQEAIKIEVNEENGMNEGGGVEVKKEEEDESKGRLEESGEQAAAELPPPGFTCPVCREQWSSKKRGAGYRMICCIRCASWTHFHCCGLRTVPAKLKKWHCEPCRKDLAKLKPAETPSTSGRKQKVEKVE